MSNGIDFVIGGTDKAGPAMGQVEKSLARLEEKTDRLSNATSRLSKITGVLAGAYAALKAATAALGGLDAINKAYDTQADAVSGLNKALELQGANVDDQSAKLQSFAGDLQKLTGIGDEATLAFMKQALLLGVNADKLEDITKASAGLAEVMGTSMEGALSAVRKAQEGNFAAFEKQFPQMKNLATAEEKLAFVTDMAAKGLEAKAEASMTASGMADRASGAIGDLMEMVGSLLAPVRMLINQGLKTLAESLQQVLTPAVEKANAIMANIGPIMDFVKAKVVQAVNGIIAAFTFVEVVVTNLGSVWEMMRATVELRFEQIKNTIGHVLLTVIPGYASWFGKNFFNLIRDAMNAVVTVVSNHISKVVDAFKALWDFIASGGSTDLLGQLGAIAGRSYLEGFESSLTDLPNIAERQLSQREKDLADKIGSIGANLGEQFRTKFAARMVKLDDELGADFNRTIDLTISDKIDNKLKASGGGAQPLQAAESRLLTRGPADKRLDMMERMLKKLDELVGTGKDQSAAAMAAASELAQIKENTDNTTQLVPTI